jgi:DNA repair exonuclease SbcCD ATPase subunit
VAKQAEGQTGTLAEQLAAARQETAGPRSRVSGLKASFDAAMAAAQFGEAERLKGELAEARQELAVAEARVNGLRQAEAAIRAQQDEEARALQEAQRHLRCPGARPEHQPSHERPDRWHHSAIRRSSPATNWP